MLCLCFSEFFKHLEIILLPGAPGTILLPGTPDTSHPAFQFAQFPFFVLAETLTIPLYFLLRQTINANFHEFCYPARRVTSWFPGAPGTISHPSFHFAMFPLTLQKRSEA